MSYSQDLAILENPTFEDLLKLAAKNLPASKRDHPWVGLNHGVKLLDNDDELNQYICAYGKMHKEKIDTAIDAIRNPADYFTKNMTIIDWGCGQGLASVCFMDYLRRLGIVPKVEKNILIEPSKPALIRAKEHMLKFLDDKKILSINKYANDVETDDISVSNGIVIHFFSNILDIPTVDINYLADIINSSIYSEQLFFCVGPQNIGASRISDFAKALEIDEDNLIKKHSGQLVGRGTINLLVFKINSETREVIKVEYRYHRNLSTNNCTALQRILKNTSNIGNSSEKALRFYRSVIELERMKSSELGTPYSYPVKLENENGTTKINIDIQEDSNFELLFKNNLIAKWPKNLSIRICLVFDNRLYNILQFIYPYEDIKDIDIENEYVSVELSSFSINYDAAEELEIGEEQIGLIESLISDPTTTWESLEKILKDAINNEIILDKSLYLSLSSVPPTLSQTSSELKQLLTKNDGAVLNDFLNGIISDNTNNDYDEDSLLQIKNMDVSQRMAVATALSSKVSVITGPPGTGKTQVILNLIANAFIKGKSVLVASKNNKAVDNIKERYDDVDPLHYLLRFGSKDAINKQLLPYLDKIIQDIQNLSFDKKRYDSLIEKYEECCQIIHKERMQLREIAILEEEYQQFPDKLNEKEAEINNLSSEFQAKTNSIISRYQDVIELSRNNDFDWAQELTRVKSEINSIQSRYSGIGKMFFNWFSKKSESKHALNNILQMPQQYSSMVERHTNISYVSDIKNGQDLIKLYKAEASIIDRILSCRSDNNRIEREHYKKITVCKAAIKELKERQTACKKRIEQIAFNYNQIVEEIDKRRKVINEISVELFNLAVVSRLKMQNSSANISRYKNYIPDRTPWKYDEVSAYMGYARAFIDTFRLNAVTNLSIKNSYPLTNGFFDIVIIDEASQCDVASALPLIYRAKQLVVIGDPLQLKHISSINSDEELTIKNHLNIAENPFVRYADYSLWDYCKDLIATAEKNNRPIVLDCHYRCHPQIIGYSNRMFYERRLGTTLNVKTIEKNPMIKQKGIIWEDVRGEQISERINRNDAEIEKCISIATNLAKQYTDISIGIISPFRDQVEEISKKIPHELEKRIIANTVHKFQGDERDIIIYSLVVTDNSPLSKIRWIDCAVPNLVNVAVTRARTTLYVVGNKRYIKTHSNLDLPLGNLVDYCENHATVQTIVSTKTYIIDTNVFVNCPDVIDRINPSDNIVLSAKVIDELDKLKIKLDNLSKRNVEAALRHINTNFKRRNIRMEFADMNCLPQDFNKKNPDNMILSIAIKYRNQNPVLLTSDNGFQVKAKGLGISVLKYDELI